MTLRLRLTLFYTLLVALVLGASGLGLYLLLRQSLHVSLDRSLQETADLLSNFMEREDGVLEFDIEEDGFPRLPTGLVALLTGPEGEPLDNLGRVPEALPALPVGVSSWHNWRIFVRPLSGETLVVLRDAAFVANSLQSFTRSFFLLAPVVLSLAFVLGYLLAARALRPVDRLTRAAYALARQRAWREVLPEPAPKDELWRLARAVNSLLQALGEVIEAERRFTSDAAHELRVPLTVLQGRLEQALERARDAGSREALEKAAAAGDDLLGLTETLLLLARTEAGQGMEGRRVALDEIAFDAAEMLRPLFGEKGLALELELPDDPLWVLGDRVSLGLLVRNLLENALKFTPGGGVRLEVGRDRERVRLVVSDTGPGFPDEALPQVFERFYQADVAHRQTGSGLGLTLAQSVARWHGGELRAANRPEGGAKLTLYLSLAAG